MSRLFQVRPRGQASVRQSFLRSVSPASLSLRQALRQRTRSPRCSKAPSARQVGWSSALSVRRCRGLRESEVSKRIERGWM